MKRVFSKLRTFFCKLFSIQPGSYKGVAIAMLILSLFMVLLGPISMMPKIGFFRGLFYFILFGGMIVGFGFGSLLAKRIIHLIPSFLLFAMVVLFFASNREFAGWIGKKGWFIAGFFFICWTLGGSLWVLLQKNRKERPLFRKVFTWINFTIGLAGLLALLYFIKVPGFADEYPEVFALSDTSRIEMSELPDPSLPGAYLVKKLYYGSGEDQRRTEYADSVSIITPLVDGSPYVDNWNKFTGKMRTRYWGYEVEGLPLNARVWYPQGEGPFPLVLIVHGNHNGMEPSDPGYAYLGELMASRGFIFASVDENFVNGGMTFEVFRSLNKENDLRGWLLLKHLEEWRKWNTSDTSIFYQKVDMENIALIGHSRGGEAVNVAAFFNTLSHYPDDARERFDFHFNIKTIIPISQVDGQYKPGNTGTPVKDVNFLALQGSFDMDVDTYHGSRQFQRVNFSDTGFFMKAGVFVHRANHGQFNTVWGNNDIGYPGILWRNRKALISSEEQRRIARLWISAFLEATLHEKQEYRSFFRDYRPVDWNIPETVLLTQYGDNQTEYWCTYEEDLDVTTATYDNISLRTEDLTNWKEGMVSLKRGTKETMGVTVGWNREDSTDLKPAYVFDFREPVSLEEENYLAFSLVATGSNPHKFEPEEALDTIENKANEEKEAENPGREEKKQKKKEEREKRKAAKAEKKAEKEDAKAEEDEEKDKDDEEEKDQPIDFSICLMDADSNRISLPLHTRSFLQPRLKANIMKLKSTYKNSDSENVFQYFEFPLKWFIEANPDLQLDRIIEMRFVFDQSEKGVIVIDNVGIRD